MDIGAIRVFVVATVILMTLLPVESVCADEIRALQHLKQYFDEEVLLAHFKTEEKNWISTARDGVWLSTSPFYFSFVHEVVGPLLHNDPRLEKGFVASSESLEITILINHSGEHANLVPKDRVEVRRNVDWGFHRKADVTFASLTGGSDTTATIILKYPATKADGRPGPTAVKVLTYKFLPRSKEKAHQWTKSTELFGTT